MYGCICGNDYTLSFAQYSCSVENQATLSGPAPKKMWKFFHHFQRLSSCGADSKPIILHTVLEGQLASSSACVSATDRSLAWTNFRSQFRHIPVCCLWGAPVNFVWFAVDLLSHRVFGVSLWFVSNYGFTWHSLWTNVKHISGFNVYNQLAQTQWL